MVNIFGMVEEKNNTNISHPSISNHLPGVGHGGSNLKEEAQNSLS